MLPQILSSLFVGVMLAVAAVMLGSAESILMLDASGMLAWLSHIEDLNWRYLRLGANLIGIALALGIFTYLITLAI